ncbi:protein of unknown function [Candidatus Filomicrobium marinum]|uniref:Uncharacterized protein n=1 Tax=Candidatus Filomicrobium marinum TaxID=1608628 RepID=A0A0D6JBL0_9HYPH|nr:protein of unknown function [Candidatus Filomicrobium marinum]
MLCFFIRDLLGHYVKSYLVLLLRNAGDARSLDGAFPCRRIDGREAGEPEAVSRAASFREHGGVGRWRIAAEAGRGFSGASRRPLPG